MPGRAKKSARYICGVASAAAGLWLGVAGEIAAQQITTAKYANPTTSYPHGVLGDDQEWSTLFITVRRESGETGSLFKGHVDLTYQIDAQPDSVFEDLQPRLWDITGDGEPEVVVIESHQKLGARLLVIGLVGEKPDYLAATPHIGRRFRWLAPIGAADLDADGNVEIAFVDRPHLAKTLRIWRYQNETLAEIASHPGVSNHRIGEDFISGGIRDCGEGPEIITANANWTRLIATRLKNGQLSAADIGPQNGLSSFSAALACN